MKTKLILAGFVFFLMQCTSDNKTTVLGNWEVDSVYTYYNGFGFTRKDVEEEPLLEYQQDGKLKMTKGNESRFFLFELSSQDTLLHRNRDGKIFEKFCIQKLNENQLVLRKEMHPVFKGNNQKRYEIRYLAKDKSQ